MLLGEIVLARAHKEDRVEIVKVLGVNVGTEIGRARIVPFYRPLRQQLRIGPDIGDVNATFVTEPVDCSERVRHGVVLVAGADIADCEQMFRRCWPRDLSKNAGDRGNKEDYRSDLQDSAIMPLT